MSRIVLAGPDTFHQLIYATAARLGISADELLVILLNQWIEKVRRPLPTACEPSLIFLLQLDNMSQGGQRKLTALALANLVPTTRAVILDRLPELVSVWSSVLAETEESDAGE